MITFLLQLANLTTKYCVYVTSLLVAAVFGYIYTGRTSHNSSNYTNWVIVLPQRKVPGLHNILWEAGQVYYMDSFPALHSQNLHSKDSHTVVVTKHFAETINSFLQ